MLKKLINISYEYIFYFLETISHFVQNTTQWDSSFDALLRALFVVRNRNQLKTAVNGIIFCLRVQTNYMDVLQRRNWCSSNFGSLVKFKEAKPTKSDFAKSDICLSLNVRKFFRSAELTFCWKFIQFVIYHNSDAKTNLHKCLLLTSEISWRGMLFSAVSCW